MKLFAHLVNFWIRYPALFYGISLLLGAYAAFFSIFSVLIPGLILIIPFIFQNFSSADKPVGQLLACLFMVICSFVYTKSYAPDLNLKPEQLKGIAYVVIRDVREQSGMFDQRLVYACDLTQFISESSESFYEGKLKCVIWLAKNKQHADFRPKANTDYMIKGELVKLENGYFRLKPLNHLAWQPVKGSFNLTEMRFAWKKAIRSWIKNHIRDNRAQSFLSGLATGQLDDISIRDQFSKFGLLHTLAISGFHFAVIVQFLALFLRLVIPRKPALIFLSILISGYFIFLGLHASVLRAWIMCILFMLGKLIKKETSGLNSLGIALCILLVVDPRFCLEMAFQLSFSTTLAILLFYPCTLSYFEKLFSKRTLSQALDLQAVDQHIYCLLSLLRSALGLTVAVNIVAIPFTLFYFFQFPILGLFYNLFFPFLLAGSICLLILAGFFSLVPGLADFIHSVNNFYTQFLLGLTGQFSEKFIGYLTVNSFDVFWLILYFSIVVAWGIVIREKNNEDPELFYLEKNPYMC